MNIGQAANASGVSAKIIRYYERIGLIPEAGRTEAGYRVYADGDVNTLRFIHRAREFGMPIDRIRRLVSLWQGKRPSREVKQVALEQVADLERKITELSAMRAALQDLAGSCDGDLRPECPILRDLEGATPLHTAWPVCTRNTRRPEAAPPFQAQFTKAAVILKAARHAGLFRQLFGIPMVHDGPCLSAYCLAHDRRAPRPSGLMTNDEVLP
jgi:MerR family transcriptional regulator, copper efflux regulator